MNKHDCLLCMGDDRTSAGWCRRTNFREKCEGYQDWIAKQTVAKKLANLILDSDSALYSQWFKGISNVATDSLSRDVHLFSDTLHGSFLQKTIAKQLPPNFYIVPLPEKSPLLLC